MDNPLLEQCKKPTVLAMLAKSCQLLFIGRTAALF